MRLLSPRPILLVAFSVLLSAPAPAQDIARRPVTVDDVLDLVQVSNAQISPNGKWVLYTRSEIKKWKDNKRVTSLWLAAADGSEAFPLTASEKDRAPQWSPDATQIAFLSTRDQDEKDKEAGAQIWVIRAAGGEATRLTDHKEGITAFRWARDGRQIFFSADDARSEEQKDREKAGDDAIYVDEGPNGQGRGHWSNLWVISLADKRERHITKEKMLVEGFAPSPDGTSIAFHSRRENARNDEHLSEIAVVDVATGAIARVTTNQAPESHVSWAPDGSTLAYLAPDDRSWELANAKLWVQTPGGAARNVTGAFEGAIRDYFWSADGKAIYFDAQAHTAHNLFRLDLASGQARPVSSGDGVLDIDSMTLDGSRAAGVYSDPTTPPDIWILDSASGTKTQITHANPQVARLTLATARVVKWKSNDGQEVEGVLTLPPGYKPGVRPPLIVRVHGGPANSWAFSFRGINHVYAGLGYAVLEPNVRGSSAYSDAWLRGNLRDLGGGDYRDLMAGVDALVAQGLADPARLGIGGWSYGGILGGWTITQTDRFKAASVGAMVTDWASEYAMGFNFDVRRWYIGGTPWENPEGYRKESSYAQVAKAKTPTIVLHGEQDTTDTIGQSMMFYQGLKDRGVPVRFIRFPREPHGFREPHHQRIRDTEEIGWMQKYVRGLDWSAPERKDKEEGAEKKKTDNQQQL